MPRETHIEQSAAEVPPRAIQVFRPVPLHEELQILDWPERQNRKHPLGENSAAFAARGEPRGVTL